MRLKDQVCSLESAKRLKELGFKQESLFWWNVNTRPVEDRTPTELPGVIYYQGSIRNKDLRLNILTYAAYTVAELGEMLPKNMCFCKTDHGTYQVIPSQYFKESGVCIEHETEAEARAKMLIYLKENNLL